MAPVNRERPIFSGVGAKLVEREPDGLRRSRVQAKLGVMHAIGGTSEIGRNVRAGPELGPQQ